MFYDPFEDKSADLVVYNAIKRDIRDALFVIFEKYKKKLNDIKKIKEGQVGFKKFEIRNLINEYINKDKDLQRLASRVNTTKSIGKNYMKKAFKECFNEVLDETPIVDINGEKVNPKTKKLLLAEKIVNDTLNGTIDPAVLKGLEVIRDTIGEKPVNEIINKGIEAKIIDVNITNDKVEKVKKILESLRTKRVIDGFGQNNIIGTSVSERGNEGVVEVSVSRESEGVHNSDVLPDKQD